MATKKIEDFISSAKLGVLKDTTRFPRRNKKFTLLRSPHVNNKSKEKFSYTIHTKEIQISTNEFTKINNYLTSANFSKLHMEIKRIENL
jgi:ribosomal protein S10